LYYDDSRASGAWVFPHQHIQEEADSQQIESGDTISISVGKMLRESAVETGHVWVRGAASSGLLHVGAVRDSLLSSPRA
jgi:hypothetical protein